ncbi:MAG: DinB family protein [Actinomycetia bacterium]|nr:DinB family protein [Actinomycetes bacterium]
MDVAELLADGYARIAQSVAKALDGVGEALTWQPDPDANTIAWLIWHLTRVQDDHVSEVAGVDQEWTAGGWAARMALPLADAETGYGHSAEQMRAVRAAPELLAGYHQAVSERTIAWVGSLAAADLDRIVDTRWDPPVTLGVRLVSVLNDDMQHVGQAAYLRGLAERR